MSAEPRVGNVWLPLRRAKPAARLRLFCFPPAGSGAAFYRTWLDAFPADVDVCPVEPPGRWSRIREPCHRRIEPLIDQLAAALRPELGLPTAFFGYSLGSMVAFELTRRLRRDRGVLPRHLFVACARAPQLTTAAPRPALAALDDAAFVGAVARIYGGIPAAALSDPELLAMIVPVMRADIEMLDAYDYHDEPALACPIVAFGGERDRAATKTELEGWGKQSASGFTLHMFGEGHFFSKTALAAVIGITSRVMDGAVRAGAP
ncbi:MAG: thioesterase [Deltaproteobacteria bacterium]|nr:thioesterase [Deltaproteobacteria bacterium]